MLSMPLRSTVYISIFELWDTNGTSLLMVFYTATARGCHTSISQNEGHNQLSTAHNLQ